MTELGGSAPLSEARVEASNWMTALALARKTIGESGGVPPGASCSVAPDGHVTIHDALARKTYSLAPDVAKSLSDRPPPKGPRVPLDAVPRPESAMPRVPRPSDPPSPRAEPAERKKVPQKTIAYDASELGIALPPAEPAPAKRAPQKTIAYDASELGIAPPAAPDPAPIKRAPQKTIAYDASELGIALPPPEPAPAKKATQTTIAHDASELGIAPPASTAPPAPATGRKRVPQKTIAYDADELGLALEPAPQPPPASTGAPSSGDAPALSLRAPSEPAPRAKVSRQTIAYDASELGLVPPADRPASVPPPSTIESTRPSRSTIAYDAESVGLVPAESAPAAQHVAIESVGGEAEVERRTVPDDLRTTGPAWDVLHSRDEEPTKDSPLVYRERTYYVPEGTSDAVAEAILLARFDELRDELADRPKGKLVNMALFDHRWTERPTRPPLLTLQWKDWRGEPAIGRPNAPRPVSVPAPSRSAPPAAPPSAPPRIEPPAPASAPTDAPATLGREPVLQPSFPAPESRSVEHVEPPFSAAPSSPPAPVAPLLAPPPVTPLAPPPDPPWEPTTPAASPAAPGMARSAPPDPTVAHTDASLVVPRSAPPPAPAVPTPVPPPSDDDLDLTISDEPVRAISAGPDDRLATAFEALQDLFFLTTPVEGLDFVMRLLEDLIPSEAASACLYDINTDELRFVALTGPGAEERQGDAVPRLAGLVGVAALAPGEAMLFEDVLSDERFDPGSDGRLGIDPENMALCAVAHGGRLLGLVQMINRRDQAQFSRADANLLTYVAAKLGEFLYEARMRPDDRQQL